MKYMWIILIAAVKGIVDVKGQNVSSRSGRENEQTLHNREKRGDCDITQWNIGQSCMCGEHCWSDSFKNSFYSVFGYFPQSVEGCVIRNQNSYQLSADCPDCETYLDLSCTELEICGDYQKAYQCTCNEGYLSTGSKDITHPCDTSKWIYVGIGIFIAVVVIYTIVSSVVIVCRWKLPRLKAYKHAKKIAEGIIPLQFNVLAVVDDVDEFKLYLTYIRDALHDQNPKLVFQRLSIYDLLHYNYEIKCDQLLVFLETSSVTVKKKRVTAINKKVKYHSIAVVCMEDDATTQPVESDEDKLCLVPSLKHIWVWLPVVLEALFQNKGRSTWTNLRTTTYYIHEDEQTPKNVQYCKELRYTLDNILTLFGAKVANSEKAAMCRIALLDSINELNKRWKSKYFIFVSWGIGANKYRQNNSMNVFGRKEIILGITRLLLEMNLIAYKGKENLEAIRYNPLSKAFIKDNENFDV